MRPLLVLGIVSIALGVYMLVSGFSLTRSEEVELGPLRATVEREEPVSPWVGAALVGIGTVLLVSAARRRGTDGR